ncbi:family 2 glycosyl transferase, partial [Streptomyces sp. SID14478]|nr:family 2 glycosyl transferase [Streptomyces sp. SID14478]
GPLLLAAGWMIAGADGPLERRDPVQVPAFVAEEAGTRDQARTLVLDGSTGEVNYSLVRGAGARLGDGELTSAAGENENLDKVVANLVAGSGADQADQLGGFAVRYVLVRDGAPRQMGRVLDATPGLTRLSQQDGTALWRIDRQVARAVIVPSADTGSTSEEAVAVAAGPVDIHTKVTGGRQGRVLRLADQAAEGWTATLDGAPLTRTTVDGWAQGFELPASGGTLDVTYDSPVTHTAWLWAQGALALVLVVLALPGRRRDVDDDLPEEPVVPAQAVAGEGRRARRLRAQAEAEQSADGAVPPPPSEEAPVADIPQQQYGEWEQPSYAGAEYGTYTAGEQQQYQGGYGYDQQADPYQADPYQADPYQAGPYDPYAYGGTYEAQEPYDPTYEQQHGHGNGADSERPDGSQQ